SGWLKLALLSWERIVRLRPREVDDRDSELVREIRAESDLLREIAPSPHDLETVAAAFFELLGDDGPLAGWGARILHAADPTLDVGPFLAPYSQRPADDVLHDQDLVWIYCGGTGTKMSREL